MKTESAHEIAYNAVTGLFNALASAEGLVFSYEKSLLDGGYAETYFLLKEKSKLLDEINKDLRIAQRVLQDRRFK